MATEADNFYGPNYNPGASPVGGFRKSDFFGVGAASGLPQSRPYVANNFALSRSSDSNIESVDDLIRQTRLTRGILANGTV